MTRENDIVKGQKTSFTAAHPSAGLDLNWETAGSYQWDDGSKAALVCVRTSPGDYYFNYDATQFPENERHRYMHPSVWLTLYHDSLGRQYSTLTSAVGDTAYLKKAGFDAMYISPLNMMDFTGDLLFFDMSKKLLGRVGYTDGRIDTSRVPVKRGLLVSAVMVSQAQGGDGDGDDPPKPGSTTVPVWDGQDITTLDEVIIKGWLPMYNDDPQNFCTYFPSWCEDKPCPLCGRLDCKGWDCPGCTIDTIPPDPPEDPKPPVVPNPEPYPGEPDEGGGIPEFPSSGQPVVDVQLALILEKMQPAERAIMVALLNKNSIKIFVREPTANILNKMTASGLDPTNPIKGWFTGAPGSKEYNLYISPAFYAHVSQNIPPVGLTLGLLHEIAHILLTEQGIHLDNHSQHVVMMGWFLQDMVEALFPGNTDAAKYGKFAGIYDTTEWRDLVKTGEYKDANKFFDKEKIYYKNNP